MLLGTLMDHLFAPGPDVEELVRVFRKPGHAKTESWITICYYDLVTSLSHDPNQVHCYERTESNCKTSLKKTQIIPFDSGAPVINTVFREVSAILRLSKSGFNFEDFFLNGSKYHKQKQPNAT